MTQQEMLQLKAMMQEVVEPINERLDNIEARQTKIEHTLGSINERLDNIEVRQTKIEHTVGSINERLDNIEARQTKLELIMENEINRAIQVIAEGHTIINSKLDKCLDLEDRVVTLENKVSAIEYGIANKPMG